MERRHPNVVNVDEAELLERSRGGRFSAKIKELAHQAGASELACNWFEVPPGKTAFPFHYHCGIEEAVFVLEGQGRLRIGGDEVAVRAGDWVTHPAGPDGAHQLVNVGETPLRYLCISNTSRADLVVYPDSSKISAQSRNPPGKPWVQAVFKQSSSVDYYEGESED